MNEPMDIRWVPAIPLIGFAALLLLMNWGILLASLWNRWRGQEFRSSMVPLAGPVLGTLGLLICPAELGWYALAFLALDPAIALLPAILLLSAYKYVRKLFV
jgi:hypothetical protein